MLKARINEGRTAEIYDFEEGKIIKLFRNSFSRKAAESEYRISSDVASLFLNAPKVYGTKTVENRFGIIFEKLIGETGQKMVCTRPWLSGKISRIMAEKHNEIHSKSGKSLKSQKLMIAHAIDKTDDLVSEEKEKLQNYLKTLPDGVSLCHGDFHPDNLIFSARGPVVIDWITAGCGSPACDIARTCLILDSKAMPANAGLLTRIIIKILRKSYYRSYRSKILKLSGLRWSDIENWILPLAAARLTEGNAPDEQAELLKLVRSKLQHLD
ncbi:MAG: phosphotransferase [Spirochaetes bacterium]|nr:phosphotransferase [Spirochaetota bacterium]MBN2769245.1 phosphotransferase [Spirochaetota bacterium]